jgi:hypothetical protein
MTYLVTDRLTKQDFPAADIHDVEEAIVYITQGSDLSDLEQDEITVVVNELLNGEVWVESSLLGVSVVLG